MQRVIAVAGGLFVLAIGLGIFMMSSPRSDDAEFGAPAPTGRERAPAPLRPAAKNALNLPIDSQVVFLYYQDLEEVAAFYGETLGFEKTYDADGAKIYRTSASSYIGLVAEGSGFHSVTEEKPVMVSLVTDGLDEWHARLREAGVEILSEPADSESAPVRAFLARDPGGYTIEFFRWLDR